MTSPLKETSPDPARSNVVSAVEAATKSGIMAVGILYALGLIVTNAYLSSFGVFNTSLARAEYAMTGALWLFCLAIGSEALGWGRKIWRDSGEKIRGTSTRWSLRLIAIVLTVTLPITTLVVITAGGGASIDSPRPWLLSAIILYTPYALRNLVRSAEGVVSAWRNSDDAEARSEWRFFNAPNDTAFFLSALLMYSQWVYPQVPRMFGGGRPPRVTLSADQTVTDVLKGLNNPSDTTKPTATGGVANQPVEYDLIFEDSDWLVLAEPMPKRAWFVSRPSVRIKRDLVKSLSVVQRPSRP